MTGRDSKLAKSQSARARTLEPVGRKGIVTAIINGVASTLDIVSFALVARILSAESLGIFLIALAVGAVVERLGSPNVAQTFIRHTTRAIEKQRADDLRRIIDIAILFEVGLLTLGLLAGLATAELIVPSGEGMIFAAVVVTVMLPGLHAPILSIAIPRAFGRHEAVACWLMLGALVKVLILYVVMREGGSMTGVVVAFVMWALIHTIGGLAIMASQARRHGAFSVEGSDSNAFSEWHGDFWAFTRGGAISVLPQAAVEFSTPLIGALSGITTAGLYRLATKVGEAARIYTNPMGFVLYSDQCAAVERDDLRRVWSQTVRWSLLIGAVTMLGLVLFILAGAFLTELIFGKGYKDAVPVITWCVAAAVPHSMSTMLQFGLFALGATNYVLRAESVATILFLTIILALRTPSAEEAAIALTLSRGTALALLATLFTRALWQREKSSQEMHRVM